MEQIMRSGAVEDSEPLMTVEAKTFANSGHIYLHKALVCDGPGSEQPADALLVEGKPTELLDMALLATYVFRWAFQRCESSTLSYGCVTGGTDVDVVPIRAVIAAVVITGLGKTAVSAMRRLRKLSAEGCLTFCIWLDSMRYLSATSKVLSIAFVVHP